MPTEQNDILKLRQVVLSIAKTELSKDPEFSTYSKERQEELVYIFAAGYLHAIAN